MVETNQKTVLPEHLLWALATQKGCIGAEILHKTKVNPEHLRMLIGATSVSADAKAPVSNELAGPMLSNDSKRIIEKAVLTANIYEHRYVGTEHLLAGIMQIKNKKIRDFFVKEKIKINDLERHLATVLKSTTKFPEFAESVDIGEAELEIAGMQHNKVTTSVLEREHEKTPALDYFARDLTDKENQKKIDPVIAREDEIQRVMEILSRRTKNNPILLGEPGVGKTAIIEGLAKRISERDVPPVLQGKRIMALDMTLVIAGTMYRGEFEERLRQVIDEVRSNTNIILFIDEVHTIIGAGATAGSLDAANILKPALARGEIRCIGATTPSEFKKNIEPDAALERRFQPVMINEPSPKTSYRILEGIAENYECFHNVKISKEAIKAAVDLSVRYLPDKNLPDKAIDLIDEAAAACRVNNSSTDGENSLVKLERRLFEIRQAKRQAVIEERFIDAINAKKKENLLIDELSKLNQEKKPNRSCGKIDETDISRVLSRMTNIPLTEILTSESKRLARLETVLRSYVLGQNKAIKAVADAVRRAKTGVNHPERPLASFLFLGPSGVGKTELAKALAKEMFQEDDALIRLDMSEYAEAFTISKLIGAPAGYVGYRESAKLTDRVKARPFSVVLFDELEKAHTDVQNLLLQIMENGEISDSTGRKINFKNTIIIITSNVGLKKFETGGLGFAGDEKERRNLLIDDVRTELEERFRPELLNRIDYINLFNKLDAETLKAITGKQLKELKKRLSKTGVKIVYNDRVIEHIAKLSEESKEGAREIRRIVAQDVEAKIADRLIKRPGSKKLEITMRSNKITIRSGN